jgi:hypothetical protein
MRLGSAFVLSPDKENDQGYQCRNRQRYQQKIAAYRPKGQGRIEQKGKVYHADVLFLADGGGAPVLAADRCLRFLFQTKRPTRPANAATATVIQMTVPLRSMKLGSGITSKKTSIIQFGLCPPRKAAKAV